MFNDELTSSIFLGPIRANDGNFKFNGQAPAIFCAEVCKFSAKELALDFLTLLSLLSKQLNGPLECSPGALQVSEAVISSSIFFC